MRLRRGCLEGEAWEALSRFCRLWRRESGCSVQALERLYRGGRLWKAREALEKRSGEVLWRGSEGSIIFFNKEEQIHINFALGTAPELLAVRVFRVGCYYI